MPPSDSSSEAELIRLRQRVAELEAELSRRPAGSSASGNIAPLALKMFAVQALLVLFSVLLVEPVDAGQRHATGWVELAYVAGLLFCLATPISVVAVNVLIFNLWATAIGPRCLIAGTLAVAAWLSTMLQWWMIDMDELNLFAGGALLMLFVPAMAFRLLTKWRLRTDYDPFSEQHAAPRTLDLLLLTVIFAIAISIIRQFFRTTNLDVTSGYVWWLSAINSLLPATAVCLGSYCSLRLAVGPNRWRWLAATVVTSLLAGGVFAVQIFSMGFEAWEMSNWSSILGFPIDMAILTCAVAAPLAIVPLLTGGLWRRPGTGRSM